MKNRLGGADERVYFVGDIFSEPAGRAQAQGELVERSAERLDSSRR